MRHHQRSPTWSTRRRAGGPASARPFSRSGIRPFPTTPSLCRRRLSPPGVDKTYRNRRYPNARYCPPPHRRCDRRGRSHLHGRGRARPKRHAEHSSGRFPSGLQCGGFDPQSRPDRAVLPTRPPLELAPLDLVPGTASSMSPRSPHQFTARRSRDRRALVSGRGDGAASVAVGCRLQRPGPGTDVGQFCADGCGGGPHRPADGAAPVGGGVSR